MTYSNQACTTEKEEEHWTRKVLLWLGFPAYTLASDQWEEYEQEGPQGLAEANKDSWENPRLRR